MDEGRDDHAASCGCGHLVEFYETDEFLAATVAEFLSEGLTGTASSIVVATAPHRDAFASALRARGIDLEVAMLTSRLVMLDAGETLAAFMGEDEPDPERFRATIAAVMDRAADGWRPLRVYGEMVAVLWNDGDVSSAIALEDLWNDLAREREFMLLCAYPMSAFDDPASGAVFARVCEQHTAVIPSEGYTDLPAGDTEQRRRRVVELQREVRVLRRSLDDLSPRRGDGVEVDNDAQSYGAGSPNASGQGCISCSPIDPGPSLASGLTVATWPAPQRRAGDERMVVLAERLAMSLRGGDAAGASEVLDHGLVAGISAATLIARVVAPAMHAIGNWWADGTLTVADEHLATATCQRALVGLYPSLLTNRPRSRERVLVAGVEGEAHELAPRVVADVLEGRGYDVIYLGPDVPAETLAEALTRHTPELVALSLTMASGAPLLGRSIAAVQSARPDVQLLLGGQGIDSQWARTGFPVATSADEAPRLVETLLRERPDMPPFAQPGGRALAPTLPVERDPIEHLSSIASELGDLARANALSAHHYRFLALDDPLTGLPNRRGFDASFRQTSATGDPVTLLFVDIDQFKQINDTFGHEAGDELLIEIGRAITDELRPGDVVARLGGDEFGVLLANQRAAEAVAVAERIRAAVQRRCSSHHATVSIGGAGCDGDQFAATLEADRALYLAKAHGRNTVRFSDSAHAPH